MPVKGQSGILYRGYSIDRSSMSDERRTVELSFSSETPIVRSGREFGLNVGDINEVLDHSPGALRMERFKSKSAPLLLNHDKHRQVGVIEDASILPDRRGRAIVRFGRSSLAEEIWNDVKDGIRSTVSVGYRIWNAKLERSEQGLDTLRATDWEGLEISFASVPEDYSVGVSRGTDTAITNEIQIDDSMFTRSLKLDADPAVKPASGGAPAPAPTPDLSIVTNQAREQATKDERDRQREINAIADRIKTDSVKVLARQAIDSGMKLDEFRCQVLEREYNAKPVTTSPELGMSKKELKDYSLVRAIRGLALNRSLEGLEKEAHEATMKQLRLTPTGPMEFFVPFDVEQERRGHKVQQAQRALEVGTFSAGGAFVETDLQTGSFIELLRNQMVVMASGARNLTGLVGDVAIPRQTGGATSYWLTETGTITASQQTVGNLNLKPHRLGIAVPTTQQLLAQSSIDVENFVRQDIAAVIAIEKDETCLKGTGVSGEPVGIVNTTGVKLVTIAAAQSMTYAQNVSFETALALANSLQGNLAFVATPTIRHNARITARFSNTDTPLWTGGLVGELIGYPARATNQLPTTVGACIFGRWEDLIVADWAGMSVLVDPYSLSLQGQVRVVMHILTDVGIRHAESFAISTT